MNKQYEIVIVGAGLAGLTSAVYLSRAGYSVLLIEKSEHCGGLLNSIERDGFVFDTGARSIENAGVIRPLLKDLGIEMELVQSPVSIGIEDKIINMETKESIHDYKRLMENLYPRQIQDIDKIFGVIEKIMKEMHVIYGFDNPVFRDLKNDRSYIFKELLPWLGRFLLAVSRMNRMNEPIEAYLGKCTSSQSLIDIISQHFFKETPMFFALGYFYVYLDYLYPKGGTGRLAEELKNKLKSTGGEIQFNTEIQSIVPSEKYATGSNNISYSYNKLLWCADLKSLYKITDSIGLKAKTKKNIEFQKRRIMNSRGGDSVFSLYLGIDMSAEHFSGITRGHLFYTASREGLGEIYRSQLKNLLKSSDHLNKKEISQWVEKYSRLTTYEISIPSLRDPVLSPAGRTGMIISFLLEYDLVKMIKEQKWYDEFKVIVENAMIDELDSSVFPGIKDKISCRFSSSPLTIERTFSSSEGGITGWTFEQPSPVVNKLQKIPKSVETPFPDILQAGQWAYSPAGIPTAILTGWYAYKAILKKI